MVKEEPTTMTSSVTSQGAGLRKTFTLWMKYFVSIQQLHIAKGLRCSYNDSGCYDDVISDVISGLYPWACEHDKLTIFHLIIFNQTCMVDGILVITNYIEQRHQWRHSSSVSAKKDI